MTQIEERLLESRMIQIEQARTWSPRVISKFETFIRSADEVSLYRANPLAFARDRGIAEPEAIDLFLHAARAGLLDMRNYRAGLHGGRARRGMVSRSGIPAM